MGGALREFLALGIFIGGCGLLMLPFQPPNSAPFVLSALSALIGLCLVGAVIYVQKRFLRSDDERD